MSKIHFVKDGITKEGESVTTSVAVPLDDIYAKFGSYSTHYLENPPVINRGVAANNYADYQHVVIEIEEGESIKSFASPGYYVVAHLSVSKCRELIGGKFEKV